MKAQLEALVSRMLDVGITYAEAVRQFRSAFVRVALVENNGNRVKTARALGVHRNTLRQTLSSLGIAVERRPPQKVEIALELQPGGGQTRSQRLRL